MTWKTPNGNRASKPCPSELLQAARAAASHLVWEFISVGRCFTKQDHQSCRGSWRSRDTDPEEGTARVWLFCISSPSSFESSQAILLLRFHYLTPNCGFGRGCRRYVRRRKYHFPSQRLPAVLFVRQADQEDQSEVTFLYREPDSLAVRWGDTIEYGRQRGEIGYLDLSTHNSFLPPGLRSSYSDIIGVGSGRCELRSTVPPTVFRTPHLRMNSKGNAETTLTMQRTFLSQNFNQQMMEIHGVDRGQLDDRRLAITRLEPEAYKTPTRHPV